MKCSALLLISSGGTRLLSVLSAALVVSSSCDSLSAKSEMLVARPRVACLAFTVLQTVFIAAAYATFEPAYALFLDDPPQPAARRTEAATTATSTTVDLIDIAVLSVVLPREKPNRRRRAQALPA